MSPRAALRLETLGFTDIYHYVGGKQDWAANGRETEGQISKFALVRHAMDRDVRTCRLNDNLDDVRKAARGDERDCVVVGLGDIVLGRIRPRTLAKDGGSLEELMEAGPSTYRPNVPLDEAAERLRDAKVSSILVTDPRGKLLGALRLSEAQRVLHE